LGAGVDEQNGQTLTFDSENTGHHMYKDDSYDIDTSSSPSPSPHLLPVSHHHLPVLPVVSPEVSPACHLLSPFPISPVQISNSSSGYGSTIHGGLLQSPEELQIRSFYASSDGLGASTKQTETETVSVELPGISTEYSCISNTLPGISSQLGGLSNEAVCISTERSNISAVPSGITGYLSGISTTAGGFSVDSCGISGDRVSSQFDGISAELTVPSGFSSHPGGDSAEPMCITIESNVPFAISGEPELTGISGESGSISTTADGISVKCGGISGTHYAVPTSTDPCISCDTSNIPYLEIPDQQPLSSSSVIPPSTLNIPVIITTDLRLDNTPGSPSPTVTSTVIGPISQPMASLGPVNRLITSLTVPHRGYAGSSDGDYSSFCSTPGNSTSDISLLGIYTPEDCQSPLHVSEPQRKSVLVSFHSFVCFMPH